MAGNIETRPGDWTCSQCEEHNFASRAICRRCHTSKDGEKSTRADWFCPICSFNNYGRNRACIKCGHVNTSAQAPPVNLSSLKPGDWVCTCGEMVFASRQACRRCGARKPVPAGYGGYHPYERPAAPSYDAGYDGGYGGYGSYYSAPPAYSGGYGMGAQKPGDWMCTCGELVFASRSACRRCNAPKPSGTGDYGGGYGGGRGFHQSRPGDWVCKGCGDLQFASRINCRKCGAGKE